MIRRMTVLGLLAVATAFLAPTNVKAAISQNIWQEFTMGMENTASDDSYETLINRVGANPTIIDVGDQFVGIFNINALTSPAPKGYGVNWTSEFTGVFQLQVLTKTPSLSQPGKFDLTFGPVVGANPLGIAGWTANDMVALFSDATPDMTTNLGLGDVASVIDGLPAWKLGFTGVGGTATPGEGWITTAVDDVSLYASAPTGATLGQFDFSVNRTFTPAYLAGLGFTPIASLTDWVLGVPAGNEVEFNGNGGLSKPGVGVNPVWFVHDDLNLAFSPLPEAGSVLVWGGLGLAFVAARIRRRRRAK
jgi:hypothetical protein